jgi:acyl carrier protein phosphodiesterase
MNYLAHLALSGEDEEIKAGNFLGDSLRGTDIKTFPPKVQFGIKLHRFIDNFTDHHPAFIKAKKFFTSEFDKYSGAIVDVCFDHFLAVHFNEYFNKDLQQFAYNCYRDTGKFYFLYPEKGKQFYQYMVQNNILFSYSHRETIEKVLSGMTYRIKEKALLYKAYPTFLDNYDALDDLFQEFFPEVMNGCSQFLEGHE